MTANAGDSMLRYWIPVSLARTPLHHPLGMWHSRSALQCNRQRSYGTEHEESGDRATLGPLPRFTPQP